MNIETMIPETIHPFRIVAKLLGKRERLSLLGIVALTFFGVLLETLSLGAIIPVVTLLQGNATEFSLFGSQIRLPMIDDSAQLLLLMGLFSILLLAKHLFVLATTWLQNGFYAKLTVRLSSGLFTKYLQRPYYFHTRHSSSELITNTQNANLVITGVIIPAVTMASDSLLALGAIALLVALQPASTFWGIGIIALFALVFYRATGRVVNRWGASQMELRRDALKLLQDGFGAVKELKVLGREALLVNQYEHTAHKLSRVNRGFVTLQSVPRLILETVAVVGLSLLAVSLSLAGRPGNEIIPILAVFAAGAFRLVPAANRFTVSVQQLRYSLPMIRALKVDLLESETRGVAGYNDFAFERLELRGVTFFHSERKEPVLKDLDFLIERGESVGIMGESGSGKSTLVDVILGLFDPVAGEVLLNDESLSGRMDAFHQMIGYVPQSVFLVEGSIRSNVAFGIANSRIDVRAVWDSLKLAQLDDFVAKLETGLDTLVGERGIRLSGGQRQRIGIARALYHRPQVLVFDEATSALDGDTESALLADIGRLSRGHTTIMVAHRASTLRNCDRVFHLHSGQLHDKPFR